MKKPITKGTIIIITIILLVFLGITIKVTFIDKWMYGKKLPEGWIAIEKPKDWNNEHIRAITDGTNVIPLPDGYKISENSEENKIDKGVVIKDRIGNEFVWIPLFDKTFSLTYNGENYYYEPTELTFNYSAGAAYDSQETLDHLYGKDYYNYDEDFAYEIHYAEMVNSVNKYGGFYIGRYETTIDRDSVGSKYNTAILTAGSVLKKEINPYSIAGDPYYYMWYGLYYAQRNNNVVGNKDYIQTNMIWGQQWDAMIDYFDSRSIDYSEWGINSQGTIVNSGISINENNEKDIIYNIYDLRANGWDWTAEADAFYSHSYSKIGRCNRGGNFRLGYSASIRYVNNPTSPDSLYSSRLTLYIK